MQRIQRRVLVRAAAALAALAIPVQAQATLMRGLSLKDMVGRSRHIVLLTALESHCIYLEIAGRRRIVTETHLRLEDVVAKASPSASELVIRTLGGQLGGEGELIHGQAEFSLGALSLSFLTSDSDGTLWVTGMAQGHYPIGETAGEARLSASPHLPAIVEWEHCAVHALAGQTVTDARNLTLKANEP